jgi:hypothetical protein
MDSLLPCNRVPSFFARGSKPCSSSRRLRLVKRAGVPEKLRPIYLGAALAVLASFGAAVVFELFFEGEHNDCVESGVMAVAVALMLYVSGWLFLRQDPNVWMNELRQHAARALSSGTAVCLGVIASRAVLREGGETILFLHALATGGDNKLRSNRLPCRIHPIDSAHAGTPAAGGALDSSAD